MIVTRGIRIVLWGIWVWDDWDWGLGLGSILGIGTEQNLEVEKGGGLVVGDAVPGVTWFTCLGLLGETSRCVLPVGVRLGLKKN